MGGGMTTLRTAAERVCAAWYSTLTGTGATAPVDELTNAMDDLRAALAQQEQKVSQDEFLTTAIKKSGVKVADGRLAQQEQEPVAWGLGDEFISPTRFISAAEKARHPSSLYDYDIPLYTRPALPLTDEQIGRLYEIAKSHHQTWLMFCRAVERAHGIGGDK